MPLRLCIGPNDNKGLSLARLGVRIDDMGRLTAVNPEKGPKFPMLGRSAGECD